MHLVIKFIKEVYDTNNMHVSFYFSYRFSKNPKCFACGAGTQGIFNKADKILERMEKLQQARLKKGKDEEGHDYDDENEGGVEIEGLAEE